MRWRAPGTSSVRVVLSRLECALQRRERVRRRKGERVREPLRVSGVLEDDHGHRAKGLLDSGQSHRRCRGDDIDLEPGHLVLVGCEERLERLVEDLVGGVDRDEAGHLSGISAGVEPTEQATERVADQDVGLGHMRSTQQRVQIADDLGDGAR